jgi:hypothetical protein
MFAPTPRYITYYTCTIPFSISWCPITLVGFNNTILYHPLVYLLSHAPSLLHLWCLITRWGLIILFYIGPRVYPLSHAPSLLHLLVPNNPMGFINTILYNVYILFNQPPGISCSTCPLPSPSPGARYSVGFNIFKMLRERKNNSHALKLITKIH